MPVPLQTVAGRRRGKLKTDRGLRHNMRRTAEALLGKGVPAKRGKQALFAGATATNMPGFSRGQAHRGG